MIVSTGHFAARLNIPLGRNGTIAIMIKKHLTVLKGMPRFNRLALCVIASLVIGPTATLAQGLPGLGAAKTAAVATVARDPYDRETPRGLVKALLGTLSGSGPATAADVLQMPQLSNANRKTKSETYFQSLHQALDRSGKLDDAWDVSGDPEGRHADGLLEDQERIGFIQVDKQQIPIIAIRIPSADPEKLPAIWMVSQKSLSEIHEASQLISRSIVDKLTPPSMPAVFDKQVLGVPVTHSAFALAAVTLLLLGSSLVVRLVVFLLMMLFRVARESKTGTVMLVMRPMLVTLAVGMTLEPLLSHAGVSVVLRGMLAPIVRIAMVVAFTIILIRLADRLIYMAIERANEMGRSGSISFLNLSRRAVKITLSFSALLVALNAIGVDLTAGLAALGIGGIAVALGSQKTIGDFVGSLSVVADRVVKIGDVCRFGSVWGTVEDIGIRSTRIRTLDRTVLSVPNGMFSSMEIENLTERDKFRFFHQLPIATPPSSRQLAACLHDLREMAFSHQNCDTSWGRIRLASFNNGLPQIEFFVYFLADDALQFAAIQEEVLLSIMDVVERHGLKIGVPAQTVQLGDRGTGGDSEKSIIARLTGKA